MSFTAPQALAGACWLGLCGLAAVTPASIGISHVTVIDTTGAAPRADATVLVLADRIAAVGAFSAAGGYGLAGRLRAAGDSVHRELELLVRAGLPGGPLV